LQFFIIIAIFNNLTIADYAAFAIIQSLSGIVVVLVTLNLDSSMQKAYSRSGLRNYINLFYLVSFPILILVMVLILKLVMLSLNEVHIFTLPPNIGVNLILVYSVSVAINSAIQSFFNATRNTFFYNFSALAYPLIAALYLMSAATYVLDELILYLSLSYLTPLVLLAMNMRLEIFDIKTKKLIKIAKYCFGYSLPSFPAIGSKLSLEYFARISIMANVGEIGVSCLAFASSVFSIFRSIERSFFRAVTPYLLQSKKVISNFQITLGLVKFQSLVTILLFSFAFLWLPFLRDFFPEKPVEVFQYSVFLIMAIVYALSLWKNYFMALLKKRYIDIRHFFIVTTLFNIMAIMLVLLFNLTPNMYLLILVVVNSLNVIFLAKSKKGVLL